VTTPAISSPVPIRSALEPCSLNAPINFDTSVDGSNSKYSVVRASAMSIVVLLARGWTAIGITAGLSGAGPSSVDVTVD